MTLILRKCYKDGFSRNGFYYGQVGDTATAPDWNPEPCCGGGLHGLKEGNGDWLLLQGIDWLVIEANDNDIVDIDENKCKFRTGKIVFRGNEEELAKSDFPNKLKLNSQSAYLWAKHIGNYDIVINKIDDPFYLNYFLNMIPFEEESINMFKNKLIKILNRFYIDIVGTLLFDYLCHVNYYYNTTSHDNKNLFLSYKDLNIIGKIKLLLFNFFNRKYIKNVND